MIVGFVYRCCACHDKSYLVFRDGQVDCWREVCDWMCARCLYDRFAKPDTEPSEVAS